MSGLKVLSAVTGEFYRISYMVFIYQREES